MTENKAGEARKGLLDSITGKAKEVAGAVTGKDDLVQEGQLQQADAQARKDAVAADAIADANTRIAADDLRTTAAEAASEKRNAHANADAATTRVDDADAATQAAINHEAERVKQDKRAHAETQADQQARAGVSDAVQLQKDADATARNAAAEHERLEAEASDAQRRAAQLRDEAPSK